MSLLNDPDDRHRAGDRRLEAQLHPGIAGGLEQLVPVLGDELLVRGHDRLPGPQRREDVLARRLDPADQLDDQVGFREDPVEVPLAATQHAGDLGTAAGRRDHGLGPLGQQVVKGAADGSPPEQADPDDLPGLRHQTSRAIG